MSIMEDWHKCTVEADTERMKAETESHLYKALQSIGIAIDMDKFIKALTYYRIQYNIGYKAGRESALQHAHWIDNRDSKYICSKCRNWVYRWSGKYNYCPHCGAKMDGGGKNGFD